MGTAIVYTNPTCFSYLVLRLRELHQILTTLPRLEYSGAKPWTCPQFHWSATEKHCVSLSENPEWHLLRTV